MITGQISAFSEITRGSLLKVLIATGKILQLILMFSASPGKAKTAWGMDAAWSLHMNGAEAILVFSIKGVCRRDAT